MKLLHREDLFGWSAFDAERNLDFHSVLWVPAGGENVVIDPLPLTAHDAEHLDKLGGASLIIVTNSGHLRAAAELAVQTGAALAGPSAERNDFPVGCAHWLGDGDEPVPGLVVVELAGSKTPGELALVLDGATLITGDLIRAHRAGSLCLLPAPKLSDPAAAAASVRRLVERHPDLDAVLVGDGWPVFRHGRQALAELVATFD